MLQWQKTLKIMKLEIFGADSGREGLLLKNSRNDYTILKNMKPFATILYLRYYSESRALMAGRFLLSTPSFKDEVAK